MGMGVIDFFQAIYLLCPSPFALHLGVASWYDAMKGYKLEVMSLSRQW
jgi:hypothetical protein